MVGLKFNVYVLSFKLETVRKSSKLKPDLVASRATVDSTETRTTIISTSTDTRAKKEKSMSLRTLRDESLGLCLFDMKSLHRIQEFVKKGYCFDQPFYEDQKFSRKLGW